jgi:hypothetical protein
MACDSTFATARDYATLICTSTLDIQKEAKINFQLNITAGAIHAAMSASDQCDCTLATWATNFLKKLNIIDAASYYVCPCAAPPITDAQRQNWLIWMNEQLTAIRKGEIERQPCQWPGCTVGADQTQAHHTDYSKPLDVMWVCRKHHAHIHRMEAGDG